jgi:LPXTG-motif cell wall-anchored protein
MLDLTVNDETPPTAFRYTINSKWSGFWTTGAGKDYINTNSSGSETLVTWKDDKKTAADMEAFGKAAAAYAKDNSITPDKDAVEAANDAAGWTGLDNGYYLVTSTYGTEASVASTPANPAQTISEKNSENTTDKDVQEAAERNDATASWGDENDAAVGDTVNFRAQVNIAKNSINVKYHDTMTEGLDWTGTANTKVYTDAALTTELASTNYSVAAGTAPETFVVTFTNEYVAGLTEAITTVYVGYSAVLNDKAVVATAEVNTGKITWGDKGESEETTTDTNTHKFTILKYDGTDSSKNPLANAKFKLYTVADAGTALKLAKNADGTIYRVVDTSDSGATLPTGYTLVTDDKNVTLASGVITVEGVDSDDYYLEETDAPTGFNPISGRIKVEVDAANSLEKKVENNSGAQLPSTGGMGTTIFYIIGAILVAGAVIVLVTKRRMTEE